MDAASSQGMLTAIRSERGKNGFFPINLRGRLELSVLRLWTFSPQNSDINRILHFYFFFQEMQSVVLRYGNPRKWIQSCSPGLLLGKLCKFIVSFPSLYSWDVNTKLTGLLYELYEIMPVKYLVHNFVRHRVNSWC